MNDKASSLSQMRARLRDMIVDMAFCYSDTPQFKLAHGGTSSFYFNCKKVTLDPEGLFLIGHLIFDLIRNRNVHAIGGLTLGADPIANAVAFTSWLEGAPIQAFVVRKEKKDHGIVRPIEGKVKKGDRVVVVDDVITTGASTIKAINACEHAGLQVVMAVVIVDRQEMNGRENIGRRVPLVESLTTRDEIFRLYRNRHGMT